MEKLELINGNGQSYYLDLPRVVILTRHAWNDVALNHIRENTGLNFTFNDWCMEAQPDRPEQIVKLFLTYNFKTRFYNNATYHNTLMLKSDYHVGFDVDSICFDCCVENHISINGLKPGDRLSC